MATPVESRDHAIRILTWVFPITYLIHIAEELWGGEGYPAYIHRLRGVELTTTRFLVAQLIGFLLVTFGILLARRVGFPSMMMIILSTTVMINGITHSYNAINNLSYNPGLLSSAFLWIPLGLLVLVKFKEFVTTKRYLIGMGIGVGINLAIAVITMRGAR
jgi:Protein of unknown function with HXXEE motif